MEKLAVVLPYEAKDEEIKGIAMNLLSQDYAVVIRYIARRNPNKDENCPSVVIEYWKEPLVDRKWPGTLTTRVDG